MSKKTKFRDGEIRFATVIKLGERVCVRRNNRRPAWKWEGFNTAWAYDEDMLTDFSAPITDPGVEKRHPAPRAAKGKR